jgi:tetratricopeptide (TPR) repeat protein
LKKGLLLIVTLIFIFVGIYGTRHYLRQQQAERDTNDAILHIDEGDYGRSIDQLKDVIATYDYPVVQAPAMYLLGNAFERKKEYVNAIETYQDLIADTTLTAEGNWYAQAVVALSGLYRQGVTTRTPQKTALLQDYLQAMIQRVQEKKETEAREESFENVLDELFRTIRKSSYDLAVKDVTNDELLSELHTELGLLYLQEKEYSRAEDILRKLDTPLARFGLARLYLETGENQRGIALLDDLVRFDGSETIRQYYVSSLFRYAESLYDDKNYSEALPLLQRVVDLDKNTEYAELSLFFTAEYYYRVKKYTTALKYIEEILNNSVPAANEQALLLRGYIYYDRREFARALKVFHDFLRAYPYSERAKTAHEWKVLCERSLKYLN